MVHFNGRIMSQLSLKYTMMVSGVLRNPRPKCLKLAFFQMASRGATFLVTNRRPFGSHYRWVYLKCWCQVLLIVTCLILLSIFFRHAACFVQLISVVSIPYTSGPQWLAAPHKQDHIHLLVGVSVTQTCVLQMTEGPFSLTSQTQELQEIVWSSPFRAVWWMDFMHMLTSLLLFDFAIMTHHFNHSKSVISPLSSPFYTVCYNKYEKY